MVGGWVGSVVVCVYLLAAGYLAKAPRRSSVLP